MKGQDDDRQLARNHQEALRRSQEPARRRAGGHEGVCGHRAVGVGPKALDTKTKELIARGISVAVRCDDCIAFHVKAAVQQGATREEIMETLGMAIYMGAGPSAMYASHALDAYTQFSAPAAE